jgi:hypothetical protein
LPELVNASVLLVAHIIYAISVKRGAGKGKLSLTLPQPSYRNFIGGSSEHY